MTEEKVVDTVACLQMAPCAVICRLLFLRMKCAVRVGKAAIEQKTVEIVALPFCEIRSCGFESVGAAVKPGVNDVQVAANYDRKSTGTIFDERAVHFIPFPAIFYRAIEFLISEWNVGVQ